MLLSIFTQRESLRINIFFLLGFFFCLAFLGLLDATYMTYVHYAHVIPPCINSGCEIVLKSKYTELLGFPNAVLGILYYGLVMMLVGIYWQVQPSTSSGKNISSLSEQRESKGSALDFAQTIPSLLLILTLLGLLAGIGLLYIQAALIHAFCQYCVTSEIIDFLLFDCAWWLWRRTE